MPFRPALRPGAPLLRRDGTHLQVGTSPGIVFPDRPGLMPLLRLLDGTRDVQRLQRLVDEHVPDLTDTVVATLTELKATGVVIDTSDADDFRRARSAHRVAFDVSPGTEDLVRSACSALRSAGLTHLSSAAPELLVIVSYGEPARSIYERSSLLGVDHLPVVLDEDIVRIGPFVRPGRTPCTACHDLHRTDWDTAWPVLLHQLGTSPARLRPSALDPLTVRVAAVEVAAEILTFTDGHDLRTTGRCLVIGPGHDERTVWPVAFHHRCACDLLNAA